RQERSVRLHADRRLRVAGTRNVVKKELQLFILSALLLARIPVALSQVNEPDDSDLQTLLKDADEPAPVADSSEGQATEDPREVPEKPAATATSPTESTIEPFE